MLDLMCLGVVVLLAIRGWQQGLLLMAISLGGIAAAYVAAYVFYRSVGRLVGGLCGLQPLLAYPLGGMAAFVAVLTLAGVIRTALRRRRRRQRRAGESSPLLGQIGGALVGASYGLSLVVLGVWALLFAQTLVPEPWLDVRGSVAGQLVLPLWERAVQAVAHRASDSERVAMAAGRFARDPGKVVRGLERVVQDERVHQLVQSGELLRSAAVAGNPRPDSPLVALARDPKFITAAQQAGLIELPSGAKPAQIERQLAENLAPMAVTANELARNLDVRELLQDPELAAKLERKDFFELANDPKFNQLAGIVLAQLRATQRAQRGADGGSGSRPSDSADPDSNAGRHRIYEWKDKRGRPHFSDRPPPGPIPYRRVDLE